jgi:hypothetical protein
VRLAATNNLSGIPFFYQLKQLHRNSVSSPTQPAAAAAATAYERFCWAPVPLVAKVYRARMAGLCCCSFQIRHVFLGCHLCKCVSLSVANLTTKLS